MARSCPGQSNTKQLLLSTSILLHTPLSYCQDTELRLITLLLIIYLSNYYLPEQHILQDQRPKRLERADLRVYNFNDKGIYHDILTLSQWEISSKLLKSE